MGLHFLDIVGFAGVSLIVGTYFLSQIGRMDTGRPVYPAINGLGAVLILISLSRTFNAPSVMMEVFWLAISLIGFGRALYLRSKSRERR